MRIQASARDELLSPLQARTGIHEIMRIMFDVRDKHRADEEKYQLHGRGVNVEGEEIGVSKAHESISQRVEIGLPCHLRTERLGIVEGDGIGIHLRRIVILEADDSDC